MDTRDMSSAFSRNDLNMVFFENIDPNGEFGVPAALDVVVAPPPAAPADAAVVPPPVPAPADPAPIVPEGILLARVYETDSGGTVNEEIHAHVQDVQVEGELLVVNTTLTSITYAVVPPAVVEPPTQATPMGLPISTQEASVSENSAAESDEFEEDSGKSGVEKAATDHEEAVVANLALTEVPVTMQDVTMLLQIGAAAGGTVGSINTATCASFVVAQPEEKTVRQTNSPPTDQITIPIPEKMLSPVLEDVTGHPKRVREESDSGPGDNVVQVGSGSGEGVSPQKRKHLAVEKEQLPGGSSTESSPSSSSSLRSNSSSSMPILHTVAPIKRVIQE